MQGSTLTNRGVVALDGVEALSWLDNLVAGDLAALERKPVVFTALLSPQGKVLFEFFVWKAGERLLIEVAEAQVEGLMKRLKMYKLRARVDFTDVSGDWHVLWGRDVAPSVEASLIVASDPRSGGALWRGLVARDAAPDGTDDAAYRAARVQSGIGEAPDDYALGDVFPHEANMDLDGGVSFTKGCYVGQEVVSRMQNKTVVRKRVVRIAGDGELTSGVDVKAGDAVIGRVGSVAGREGLASLRLDRALEALDGGGAITAGGQTITVDAAALERYRRSVKERPVIDL